MLFYFTSKVLPFPYPLKCLWYALRDKPNTHAAPSTFGPNLAVKSDNAFVHWKLSNTRIKSTEPLSKMSQCRKMSNVLEERLLLSCSTVYNTLTQLAVFIGCHQQDQNTSNGKRITRKWPLDLSSTANEVRAFRPVFLFDVFDLMWVETH